MTRSIGLTVGAMLVSVGAWFMIDSQVSTQRPPAMPAPEIAYPISKTIKFGFEVENPTNRTIPAPEFWAYLPVTKTAHQYVRSVDASVPIRVITYATGNQRAVFSLRSMPPYGRKYVEVTIQLGMSEHPIPTGIDPQPQSYLGPQRFMESDAPEIRRLATGLNVKTHVSRAVDWVHREITNPGYVANDRGALYALRARVGDCSDHMNLLGALLRAAGLPARGIAGFVQPESGLVRASQLHNWIEYYDGTGWVGLDSDRGLAALPGAQYVAMRILHADDYESAPGFEAAFGAPPGLIVRMD